MTIPRPVRPVDGRVVRSARATLAAALLVAALPGLAAQAPAPVPTPPSDAAPVPPSDATLPAAAPALPVPAGPSTPLTELLVKGQRALADGDAAGAIAAYQEARTTDPASPELAYNLGVATYRAGQWKDAASLFREAASGGSAALAAKAMFNRATALYAGALQSMPKQDEGAAPGQPSASPPGSSPAGASAAAPDPKVMEEVKASLEQSIVHFRDTLRASPDDADARVNAEKAWRLLKSIKDAEQQQQQQQQQQQNQDQQKQDQQKQDQQKQDQQQQDQQKQDQKQDQQQQDQQKQDQQKQDQQKQDQQKQQNQQQNQTKNDQQDQGKQDQSKPDQQKPDQQKPDQQKPDQQKQDPQKQDPQNADQSKQDPTQQQQQQQQPGQAQPVKLSKEEAERLLQMVRDKEKQRRAQILAKQRSRQQPVNRDW